MKPIERDMIHEIIHNLEQLMLHTGSYANSLIIDGHARRQIEADIASAKRHREQLQEWANVDR